MSWQRVHVPLCAALLLVAMAAESLAAIAPGTPIRVTTTNLNGQGPDRFEGRLVSGVEPLTLVTSVAGDTLRVFYSEITKVETGKLAKAKRSKTGTVVGALLIGGFITAAAFYKGLDENSGLARSRHSNEIFMGISAAGVLVGGYLGGARYGTNMEWREIRKSELRASE